MKVFSIIVSCLLYYNVFSQTITFNKRMTLGCGNTVLTSLEVTDSCYYATGFVRDSVNCNKSILFVKFDSLGNVLLNRIHYGAESWNPFLRTTLDKKLVIAPYLNDSVGMHGGLFHFSQTGNLVWNTLYNNPYATGGFIRPDDMQVTNDSGFIIVNSVNNPISATDLSILKLDKNGNQEWHVPRGLLNYVESWGCVYVDNNNSYIVGYMQDNLSGVQTNYIVRSILEKLDSAGNTIWTYTSPNNQQIHGVNDLIKSKDGGWVVASAWGSEYVWSPTNHQILSEAYVYKLDSARNFLWGTKFSGDSYVPREQFNKIIELEDSSIIAFGSVERVYPQPNPAYYIVHGRVAKLSPQGDSLWSREYEYLHQQDSWYSIYDAERTYDGGFLVCGGADYTGSGPYQQGWLLKLDEHGCLVPGCQLPLGTLPVGAVDNFRLSLYPNPTVDYLNVFYQSEKVGSELAFSVYDMQGRLIQSYTSGDVSDKTYIVPVYELASGLYIMELRRDGKLLKSEQFVKN